jgi:hypothetical protein
LILFVFFLGLLHICTMAAACIGNRFFPSHRASSLGNRRMRSQKRIPGWNVPLEHNFIYMGQLTNNYSIYNHYILYPEFTFFLS